MTEPDVKKDCNEQGAMTEPVVKKDCKELGANGDAGVSKELVGKIIKQVEYYFGDINLMKDKFLKEKIQEDDGWVGLDTMLKFNRLKSLSDDPVVICDALRKSDSGLVEVSEDNIKIRRHPENPLPGDSKERRDEISSRSVYAKEFPADSALDTLMHFFEGYGEVENIFMRRDFHKKTFKGSVFVTYAKKEDAEKLVQEEGTKFKDIELITKFKADYYKGKVDERNKRKSGNKEVQEEVAVDEEDEEEKAKQQMTKNAVLHLSGMDPATTREEVRTFFDEITLVGWVDFDSGVKEGYLRLREPNSAEAALEKAKAAGDGKIVLKGKEIEVRAVEGEEELNYWKKMFKEIASRNSNKRKGGGGRGGGRGGRRGGGRGHHHHGKRRPDNRNREDGEPKKKTAKTDE